LRIISISSVVEGRAYARHHRDPASAQRRQGSSGDLRLNQGRRHAHTNARRAQEVQSNRPKAFAGPGCVQPNRGCRRKRQRRRHGRS